MLCLPKLEKNIGYEFKDKSLLKVGISPPQCQIFVYFFKPKSALVSTVYFIYFSVGLDNLIYPDQLRNK